MARPKRDPNLYKPGDMVGFWLLIELLPVVEPGRYYWAAECTKCKGTYRVDEYNMRKGKSTHCRACNKRPRREPRVALGDRQNHWVVTNPLITKPLGKSPHKRRLIEVQCVCGYRKAVREHYYFYHMSKSCGCMRGLDHIPAEMFKGRAA